jgi:hypothetical protein
VDPVLIGVDLPSLEQGPEIQVGTRHGRGRVLPARSSTYGQLAHAALPASSRDTRPNARGRRCRITARYLADSAEAGVGENPFDATAEDTIPLVKSMVTAHHRMSSSDIAATLPADSCKSFQHAASNNARDTGTITDTDGEPSTTVTDVMSSPSAKNAGTPPAD